MRFLKEYIVLIIIFILLITFDVLSRNYTEKSIQFLNSEVDEIIKISLYEENFDNNKILKKIEEFEKDWKKRQEVMSFYAEHNELEKVNVAISLMKSKIEVNKIEDAYENMVEIKYRIEHIKEKQELKLNNIF